MKNKYFVEVIGFSLFNKNSFKKFKNIIKSTSLKVNDLTSLSQDEKILFIGEIIFIKEITTKTGKRMGFTKVTNGEREIDIIIWSEIFKKYSFLLNLNKKYIIYGTVDLKRGETIILNKIEEMNNE